MSPQAQNTLNMETPTVRLSANYLKHLDGHLRLGVIERLCEQGEAAEALGYASSEATFHSPTIDISVGVTRYAEVQIVNGEWVFDHWVYLVTDGDDLEFPFLSWSEAVATIVGLLEEGAPGCNAEELDAFYARHTYKPGKRYRLPGQKGNVRFLTSGSR